VPLWSLLGNPAPLLFPEKVDLDGAPIETRKRGTEAPRPERPSITRDVQFWNYPLQGLLIHEDGITS
jgi:hypothetical protein